MKKSLVAFVLMAGIGLNAHAMGNPEFHIEKDPYKIIPQGAYIIWYDTIIEDKYSVTFIWYNPGFKDMQDYKNNYPPSKEDLFVDINEDGIPDMTLFDAEIAYRKMKVREENSRI